MLGVKLSIVRDRRAPQPFDCVCSYLAHFAQGLWSQLKRESLKSYRVIPRRTSGPSLRGGKHAELPCIVGWRRKILRLYEEQDQCDWFCWDVEL